MLQAHLPEFLDDLIKGLLQLEDGGAGRQRTGPGEDRLEQVIQEYGLLQSVLLEFLHREARPSPEGIQLILDSVNKGIREAAVGLQHARTQTEKLKSGERERLISAFKAATAATAIVHGPQFIYEFANDEYLRLFLGTREYLGLPLRRVLPELEGTGIFEQLDESFRTGRRVEQSEVPLHFRTADGTMKLGYYTYTFTPHFDESGRVQGLLLMGINVTDYVLARQAIQRSQEQLQLITDRLPAFVSYIDREGRYRFVNRTYETWYGIKGSEMLGKKRRDFTTEETADLAEPYERRALSGEPVRYENVLRKPSGEYTIQDVEFVPDRDSETGEIRGAIIVAHDITEQKKSRQALEDAIRARDEFLSIASHELKTPLTSIQLQTQMMKRSIEQGRPDAFDPPRVTRLVVQTDKSVQRLTRLVDDILDISRISTGKLTFTPETFDLCELAREVVERMAVQASGARITCESQDQVEGAWDRFRIDQVLTNLVTNAIRYGQGSPVKVTVHCSGPYAELRVRDQGPGITPENQERIFLRFERATSASTVSGLGLGLYISREIIERHGGSIRVESEPGKGATFIVKLPLRVAPP
ncbi:PAS domain-containing protein [Archangium violaceum]|uniref:sensor histidine kinase n=1 Tax=Archangium violaceum TaxID=83451 RepID=UPI001950F486|nr:ATP-binding protein [Archangium violaceum]QRN96173.1 PAS domain-containing protein [Archangium violaceum]